MSGDTAFPVQGTDRSFKVSRASADYLHEAWGAFGVIITGRRDFDVSEAWGGESPMGVPIIILTHRVPQEWVKPGGPFTFVTDGIESALAQARKMAGDKNVVVSGTKVVQQFLNAGLVDEIAIDLAPILLGSGIRLFDDLIGGPINLERTRLIVGQGVTHLVYRVVM
jgi:dihydrofolate reductase